MKILLKYAAILLSTCSVGFSSDLSTDTTDTLDDATITPNDVSRVMAEEFIQSLENSIDELHKDDVLTEQNSDLLEGLNGENSSLVPDEGYVDVDLGEPSSATYDDLLALNPDLEIPDTQEIEPADSFSQSEEKEEDEATTQNNFGLEY